MDIKPVLEPRDEGPIHYAPYGRNADLSYPCGARDGGVSLYPLDVTCEGCKRLSPGIWPQVEELPLSKRPTRADVPNLIPPTQPSDGEESSTEEQSEFIQSLNGEVFVRRSLIDWVNVSEETDEPGIYGVEAYSRQMDGEFMLAIRVSKRVALDYLRRVGIASPPREKE